jgi:hypothetical protein
MVGKVCRECGLEKPLDQFGTYKPTGKPEGKVYLRHICKPCNYEVNGETTEQRHARQMQAYYKNHEKSKKNARERRRKATKHIYESFFESQGGVCAICGNPETATLNGRVKALALDHCHTTGKYRGLLCTCCNTALGQAKDDVTILENMIRYLKNG